MEAVVVKEQLEKELLQPCMDVDNSSLESPIQDSSKLNVSISSSSSSPPAFLNHKKRKHSTRSGNVTAVDIDSYKYAYDIVSALQLSFVQSDRLLLTLVRRLLSRLNSSSDSASPALAEALCASGFLKLLPQLLLHSSSNVAKKSAEALSLLAISSYEVNCQVATEEKILVALAHLLSTAESDVLLVAMHGILNVTTTALGCTSLREVAGLPEQLLRLVSFLASSLHGFVQPGDKDIFDNSRKCVDSEESIRATETVTEKLSDHQMPREENLDSLLHLTSDEAIDLFDLVLCTLNTVFLDVGLLHLSGVPHALVSLQRLWNSIKQLHSQFDEAFFNITNHWPTLGFILAPRLRSQLAKLIMLLAMEARVDAEANSMDARKLFSKELCSMDHFFQKHWELSPAQMTIAPEINALSRFFEKIAGYSPVGLLERLVDTVTACPPAVADELDLTILLKDMEHDLGCLPVYNQDIRLLKCKGGVEVSYPISTSSVSSKDCIQAYISGYTVVLRGLQFRFPEICALSNGLAAELGQVTVGANLYLTPPGSQGLRVHFDDHCVFVCQLRGRKGWDVYPPLEQLPRLYSFKTLSTEVTKDYATHFDLQEWDTLYIPRGFLHEARTECPEQTIEVQIDRHVYPTSNPSEWHGASLHVSFGVEVEPPFEWEGLLHMALRSWCHRSRQHTMLGKMHEICEILLHVAIRNVGNSCHLLRKACMLRSSQMDADAECLFHVMLKEVGVSADFQSAIQAFQKVGVTWLDWVRHLSVGHFDINELGWDCDMLSKSDIVTQLEDAFLKMRGTFILEASFIESVKVRAVLLNKYRKSRQKLMNGLLALH